MSSTEEPELNQKSIIELQQEITEFKNRERSYIFQLYTKEKIINQLTEFKQSLLNQINILSQPSNKKNNYDDFLNPIIYKQYKEIKKILKEKESILLNKQEEVYLSQNNTNFATKIQNKYKKLYQENLNIFSIIQQNLLENMKNENNNEKNQINILMLKLKENDESIKDYENQIDESNEMIEYLKRKTKNKNNIKDNIPKKAFKKD
jgi:hypothetical protein